MGNACGGARIERCGAERREAYRHIPLFPQNRVKVSARMGLDYHGEQSQRDHAPIAEKVLGAARLGRFNSHLMAC